MVPVPMYYQYGGRLSLGQLYLRGCLDHCLMNTIIALAIFIYHVTSYSVVGGTWIYICSQRDCLAQLLLAFAIKAGDLHVERSASNVGSCMQSRVCRL